MKLKGKAAIVTGASSGIGQAIAHGALFLASEEASCIHGYILMGGGWLDLALPKLCPDSSPSAE